MDIEEYVRRLSGGLIDGLGADERIVGRALDRAVKGEEAETLDELADAFAEWSEAEQGVSLSADDARSIIEAAHDEGVLEGRAQAIVETEQAEPADADTSVPFGKHEGMTIEEIARQHPGYAEWAAEEMTGNPSIMKGFANALEAVEGEEDADGEDEGRGGQGVKGRLINLALTYEVRRSGDGKEKVGVHSPDIISGSEVRGRVQMDKSGLSPEDRTGEVTFTLSDGAYRLRETNEDGETERIYVAVSGGAMYRIGGRDEAIRFANGSGVSNPGDGEDDGGTAGERGAGGPGG
jgi:hypothetical protein